jgi:ribbon-helix-helix CopG family protein
MRRAQIYLDQAQHRRISSRARARGTTASDLIREAVDAYLDGSDDGHAELLAFRAAVRAAAGTIPRLPKGSVYVDEIRAADRERDRDLEARRSR